MPKFKYKYAYVKHTNLIFKLKLFEDDTFLFRYVNRSWSKYNKSSMTYSEILNDPDVVIGTLKALRFLYEKK